MDPGFLGTAISWLYPEKVRKGHGSLEAMTWKPTSSGRGQGERESGFPWPCGHGKGSTLPRLAPDDKYFWIGGFSTEAISQVKSN